MKLLLCILTWQWVVLICWICLVLGVVFMLWLYLKLKYFSLPCLNIIHEREMKDKANKNEIRWFYLRRMEEPLEKELEKCKKELGELKQKEKEINSLKQEKNDFRITILEEKIKIYEEAIKHIKG